MGSCQHHENHSSCIESVPIFSSLSQDEMLEIAHITEAVSYKKGDMVYTPGNIGGKLYVLHTGQVKISRLSASGKEQVIRVLGPGDFMGELSLFSSLPLTDNAEVLKATTMCVIKGERLKELMVKYPFIAFKVMDELSKRLEKVENLIEIISLNSVEQRLAQALLELSEGKDEILLTITKGDLASQMGMSQETLSRKLTAFQEEGLIELKGHRRITLLNRAELEAIIEP
ncbi:Crp/Fnr family transcriptional regulator [Hydrogenoanaerobacterium sp.]|uniref:Crp/Fnr family transcriptional regulator n=1 Tax=Hydrogenoanaerobacterium sp. TaxID=2953763 RepID=UPI0028993087|nr:Crp/Fnr family transcriptional regulator [Hydrogenoanaerobacterium sp.]